MEERLSLTTWVITFGIVAVLLGVANYGFSFWVLFLSFSAGFTCANVGYKLETILLNWLDSIAEE